MDPSHTKEMQFVQAAEPELRHIHGTENPMFHPDYLPRTVDRTVFCSFLSLLCLFLWSLHDCAFMVNHNKCNVFFFFIQLFITKILPFASALSKLDAETCIQMLLIRLNTNNCFDVLVNNNQSPLVFLQ